MSFKKNNYIIFKNVLSKETSNICYKYLILKEKAVKLFFEKNFISPYTRYFGTFGDSMVKDTYSHYADFLMETLLQEIKPIMEKITNLKLIETYSYTRLYKKGDILKKHKDRFSCEISSTLNLGGDFWPIFIKNNLKKEIKVNLNPGDMLVYRGNILEHWREKFEGNICGQVFLHYNDINTKNSIKNKFDTRESLGLPEDFKNEI
jgi:hypothetical protein